MGIGFADDEEELRSSVASLLARVCPPAAVRAALDAESDKLPEFWGDLAEQGWFALAVPESLGGLGLRLLDLCVVAEQAGRWCVPGPVLPTMVAALVCADSEPGLLDGSVVAGVGLSPELVLGAGVADLTVVLDAEATLGRGSGHAVASLDTTRRVGIVERDGRTPLAAETAARGRALLRLLLAAEACGIAGWCLDTTVEHAKQRVQFGRPIGQFQAVKHRCADLLVSLEQARACVWDAARALEAGAEDAVDREGAAFALAVAQQLAVENAVSTAKACIQLLGGIGYTWEHPAHIYLKRALSVRALLGDAEVGTAALAGARRPVSASLPAEAERVRAEIRAAVAEIAALPKDERVEPLIAGGWVSPHWPQPYGRGASPVEQVVIDEEFRAAKVRRPHLGIGAWALPTLIAHGSPEQQERFIEPTLRGDVRWCQLFSEPGAGSDLAALSTRAEKAEGGYRVTGQKVWTSLAREATHGILLARTASAREGSRHAGISYFVVDMSTAGIDIRPLRELTGMEMFNEVFLDDVFIPDSGLVGDEGEGWSLARTTLANERVSMSTGETFGAGLQAVLGMVAGSPVRVSETRIGDLVAEAQSLALMRLRSSLRSLTGAQPGPESSLVKLLGAEHDQRVQELGLELLGPAGATLEGAAANWSFGFLATRCLTIAGGTSEVQRNVVAERLLGLPKDP